MKKNDYIFIMLVIIMLSLSLNVNFALEDNITDNIGQCNEYCELNSANNDVINTSGSFTDLYFAINQLDNGGTINLTNNIMLFDGERFSEGITINKDITIEGNGFSIIANSPSGKVYASVLNIKEGCNVTLRNLNIMKAYTAIINNYANLNLEKVNFINCLQSRPIGSCVMQYGGFLNLNESIVTSCSAPAFYFVNGSDSIINDAIFSNNVRAIYNSEDSEVIVNNSAFISNTGGGAISNEGNLTVINSVFNSNTGALVDPTPSPYGMLYYEHQLIYGGLHDGSAIFNAGGNVNIINSNFNSNGARGGGGAIASHNGNVLIYGSNFTKNDVYQDHVNSDGASFIGYNTNLTLINSVVSGNRHKPAFSLDYRSNATVLDSVFKDNERGGLAYTQGKNGPSFDDDYFNNGSLVNYNPFNEENNIKPTPTPSGNEGNSSNVDDGNSSGVVPVDGGNSSGVDDGNSSGVVPDEINGNSSNVDNGNSSSVVDAVPEDVGNSTSNADVVPEEVKGNSSNVDDGADDIGSNVSINDIIIENDNISSNSSGNSSSSIGDYNVINDYQESSSSQSLGKSSSSQSMGESSSKQSVGENPSSKKAYEINESVKKSFSNNFEIFSILISIVVIILLFVGYYRKRDFE